jgi:thioredoxin reductase
MKLKDSNIAIVGAGPAGASAAIQLARYGFSVTVFEAYNIGGLAMNANLIENYLGFPNGISGLKFCELLNRQITNHSIEIVNSKVNKIRYIDEEFSLNFDGKERRFDKLILAVGTKPVIPSFINANSEKVFYSVISLLNERNRKIGIYGAGDAAFDYALNLSENNEIIIFNRSDRIKSLDLLCRRAELIDKIKYEANSEIVSICETDEKLRLGFVDNRTEEVDYLLIAVGREANRELIDSEFIKEMDLLIDRKKLFLIGDLMNGKYRQISISAADGLKAAMTIYQDLNK